MRPLAYAFTALLLLIGTLWPLSQFKQLGVSYGGFGERWTIKALPTALVIDRIHPLPNPEGLHVTANAAGTLTPGFAGFTATTYEPIPGVRYEYLPGRHLTSYAGRASIMASMPPNIYLNALAFRWWFLELAAAAAAALAWSIYLRRIRKHARGFPIDPAAANSLTAKQPHG